MHATPHAHRCHNFSVGVYGPPPLQLYGDLDRVFVAVFEGNDPRLGQPPQRTIFRITIDPQLGQQALVRDHHRAAAADLGQPVEVQCDSELVLARDHRKHALEP